MVAFVLKVFICPLVLAFVYRLGLVDALLLVPLPNLPRRTLFFLLDFEREAYFPIVDVANIINIACMADDPLK